MLRNQGSVCPATLSVRSRRGRRPAWARYDNLMSKPHKALKVKGDEITLDISVLLPSSGLTIVITMHRA